ncbi:unnamed protein product [Oppiella nova]|uniref:C2H2-type domain-containing protein n=1 Tax=Oppiella nova TaxID=334625 RepID=A0A7R9LZ88_9ACAR|nr:unnamed protein product [Oppiella nova]CAG2167760.1 unnamed protein product [Oppiella nova]
MLFQCDICHKDFKSLPTFKKHNKAFHSVLKLYVCSRAKCRYGCNSSEGFSNHLREGHHIADHFLPPVIISSSSPITSIPQTNSMNTPNESIEDNTVDTGAQTSSHTLESHVNTTTDELTVTPEKPYKCDVNNCDQSYRNEVTLIGHKWSVHRIPDPTRKQTAKSQQMSRKNNNKPMDANTSRNKSKSTTGPKGIPFMCAFCWKKFDNETALNGHTKANHIPVKSRVSNVSKTTGASVPITSTDKHPMPILSTGINGVIEPPVSNVSSSNCIEIIETPTETPVPTTSNSYTSHMSKPINTWRIPKRILSPRSANECIPVPITSSIETESEAPVAKKPKITTCPQNTGSLVNLATKNISKIFNKKTFGCDLCDKVLDTSVALTDHMVANHVNGFDVNDPQGSDTHGLASDEPQKAFKCKECDKEFDNIFDRKRHQKATHSGSVLYRCGNGCPERFSSQSALDSHTRKAHSLPPENSRNPSVPSTSHNESTNDESTTRPPNKGPKGKFSCCGQAFHAYKALSTHIRIAHMKVGSRVSATDKTAVPLPYVCDVNDCGNRFSSESLLDLHKRNLHSQQIPHEDCYNSRNANVYHEHRLPLPPDHTSPRDLTSESPIDTHNIGIDCRESVGNTAFRCQYRDCELVFDNKDAFDTHLRFRHRVRVPYLCRSPGCNQKFDSVSLVKRHYYETHKTNGGRVRPTLSNHSRTSSERPFGNTRTGNTRYTSPRDYRSHSPASSSHSRGEPSERSLEATDYRCKYSDCRLDFDNEFDFVMHNKRIHGLPVPYNCRYPGCDQSFTSQELVQRHHRESHRSPVRTTISSHSRSSSERSFSTNASTTRPTARSPELFKCTDCGKIVGTQEALRGHYLANHII